jgi:hypothetical protein
LSCAQWAMVASRENLVLCAQEGKNCFNEKHDVVMCARRQKLLQGRTWCYYVRKKTWIASWENTRWNLKEHWFWYKSKFHTFFPLWVSTLYSSTRIKFDQNRPFAYQTIYQYFNVFNKIVMRNRPQTHSISMMTISPMKKIKHTYSKEKEMTWIGTW